MKHLSMFIGHKCVETLGGPVMEEEQAPLCCDNEDDPELVNEMSEVTCPVCLQYLDKPPTGFRVRFEGWKKFHSDNPVVYEYFLRFALDAIEAGRTRFSARAIGERIRWYTQIETNDPDYKINDHYWPYYARLLTGTDERFASFFVLKSTRFDSSIEEIVAFSKAIPIGEFNDRPKTPR
jgi:hypothetical protein